MFDQHGRAIDYMRISVTDRCNLRCCYCMPKNMVFEPVQNILHYDEILRICRIAVKLGITKFKITGGEPLVRPDCVGFISELKALPGVEQVTLTTNGVLLAENLDALSAAGISGINISLDTLNSEKYKEITNCSFFEPHDIMALLRCCCDRGIHTKINSVLLQDNFDDVVELAAIAEVLPVDVRYIELMPIGIGGTMTRISPDDVVLRLRERWPDLHPTNEVLGNGPAHYYESTQLIGKIGFIDAVSHAFCSSCNRVRLTSTGQLKPCLCYDSTVDLRSLIRGGCTDDELQAVMYNKIYSKPLAHCFSQRDNMTEYRIMSQIGG
jgi:cyclic pyranopterin phosphate synthase